MNVFCGLLVDYEVATSQIATLEVQTREKERERRVGREPCPSFFSNWDAAMADWGTVRLLGGLQMPGMWTNTTVL